MFLFFEFFHESIFNYWFLFVQKCFWICYFDNLNNPSLKSCWTALSIWTLWTVFSTHESYCLRISLYTLFFKPEYGKKRDSVVWMVWTIKTLYLILITVYYDWRLTAQKMKFAIKDFFSKYDHILSFLIFYFSSSSHSCLFTHISCSYFPNTYLSCFQSNPHHVLAVNKTVKDCFIQTI